MQICDLTPWEALLLAAVAIGVLGCDPTETVRPFGLALGLPPAAHKVYVVRGARAPSDSFAVVIVGDRSTHTNWTASKKKGWTTLASFRGTGDGLVRWTRSTPALAAGTYVDTITVAAPDAAGSPWQVLDSVIVTPTPTTGLRIPSEVLKRCIR